MPTDEGPLTQVYFRMQAGKYYRKYIEVQYRIELQERNALDAAGGHKPAAKQRLEDTKTPGGYLYAELCSDRKRYMELAQLNALMALVAQEGWVPDDGI
jgi:hypothetical protein